LTSDVEFVDDLSQLWNDFAEWIRFLETFVLEGLPNDVSLGICTGRAGILAFAIYFTALSNCRGFTGFVRFEEWWVGIRLSLGVVDVGVSLSQTSGAGIGLDKGEFGFGGIEG